MLFHILCRDYNNYNAIMLFFCLYLSPPLGAIKILQYLIFFLKVVFDWKPNLVRITLVVKEKIFTQKKK